MKIRIPSFEELNPGHPKHDGDPSHPVINGVFPSLETCEITDDDGNPIADIAGIDIRIRPGEAVVATVQRYDVHGEINAAVERDAVTFVGCSPEQEEIGKRILEADRYAHVQVPPSALVGAKDIELPDGVVAGNGAALIGVYPPGESADTDYARTVGALRELAEGGNAKWTEYEIWNAGIAAGLALALKACAAQETGRVGVMADHDHDQGVEDCSKAIQRVMDGHVARVKP